MDELPSYPDRSLSGSSPVATTLEAMALDPDGEAELTYEWVLRWPYDIDTGRAERQDFLGAGPTLEWDPAATIKGVGTEEEFEYHMLLELRVTDSDGAVGTTSVIWSMSHLNEVRPMRTGPAPRAPLRVWRPGSTRSSHSAAEFGMIPSRSCMRRTAVPVPAPQASPGR